MHVSVAQKIRTYLDKLAPGTIISSQGLIHMGSRGALDMALSRLNSIHRIKRKALGIYINTPDGEDHDIDPQTLAEAKAQAFNKTILPFGKTIAHLLKFPQKKPRPSTEQEQKQLPKIAKWEEKVLKFYATGSGVNIKDMGNCLRIKCIPLSPKKLRNYPMEGGYWVNAVRYMGQEYFYKHWKLLFEKLPPFRSTLASLRESFVLMPEWLYSNLCINWASKQNQRKHQLIEIPERVENLPREHLNMIWGPGFKEGEEVRKIRY